MQESLCTIAKSFQGFQPDEHAALKHVCANNLPERLTQLSVESANIFNNFKWIAEEVLNAQDSPERIVERYD